MGALSNVQIYNKATSAFIGSDVNTNSAKALSVQITGTSVTHQINFYGSLDNINYTCPLEGINQGNSTITANKTTGINELWQFDVSTLMSFRAQIMSIADGSSNYISIRAIAME